MKKEKMFKMENIQSINDNENKKHKVIRNTLKYSISIFGDGQVGKTSIINRFLYGEFQSKYIETIEDIHRKTMTVDDKLFDLDILDTAGNYQFPAMRRLAIRNSEGFILVYSLNDKASFKEMQRLYSIIVHTKQALDIPIIVAANKCDLRDVKVSSEEIEKFQSSWLTPYTQHIQVSAKQNLNIEKMFYELFQLDSLIKEKALDKGQRNSLSRFRSSSIGRNVYKKFSS